MVFTNKSRCSLSAFNDIMCFLIFNTAFYVFFYSFGCRHLLVSEQC